MRTHFSMLKTCCLLLVIMCIASTSIGQSINNKQADEIRKVEKQFETDLLSKGAAYAFEKFAAPDAVIKRQNDSLIYGPAAIKNFYSAEQFKTAKATWAPDHIEVSADGTLAYTYGKFQWKSTDKNGKPSEFHGIFHTVWKKQSNGEWKYVWD